MFRPIFSLLVLGMLALGAVNSHAVIVGPQFTDNGRAVNLSGLDWLELTVHAGKSRSQIENLISSSQLQGGWRYASRAETDALVNSLWGGAVFGLAPSNYDGAKWFFDNFGTSSLYGASGYAANGFSSWQYNYGASWTVLGSGVLDAECLFALPGANSCAGFISIDIVNDKGFILPSTHSAYLDYESVSSSRQRLGNLMVRVAVPEPGALGLIGLGLTVIGLSRRKRLKTS